VNAPVRGARRNSSHYGRFARSETPEGPNIGLISSLSTFARVNEFGFIESPYPQGGARPRDGPVDYLTADQEEKFVSPRANAPLDARTDL